MIYLVILSKYIIYMITPEHIASNGKSKTQFSPLAKTNVSNIDDKAPATQNTL